MQAITNGNDVPWNNLIAGNGSPLPISVNLQEKKKKSTLRSPACICILKKDSEKRWEKEIASQLKESSVKNFMQSKLIQKNHNNPTMKEHIIENKARTIRINGMKRRISD